MGARLRPTMVTRSPSAATLNRRPVGRTKRQEEYREHGPVQRINVKSINVQAIVCEDNIQASIYVQAMINGSGSIFYRIKVEDLAEPGVGMDTYWILLQNGYNSGEKTLEGGNIQIKR